MRRVVVTGSGIVSSVRNNAKEIATSPRAGRPGIEGSPEMVEHGFRIQDADTLKIGLREHVHMRTLRFMGPGAAYAHIAMEQEIADAGRENRWHHDDVGRVVGGDQPGGHLILPAPRPGAR